MNKYKKLLIIVLSVILVGLLYKDLNTQPQVNRVPNEKVVRDFKANLVINDGINTFVFDAEPFVGKSALEATLKVTNGDVVMSGTGVNAFVTSLKGRAVDSDKHEFWELFVNGLSSKVGAGSYIIQKGDNIEWHINLY